MTPLRYILALLLLLAPRIPTLAAGLPIAGLTDPDRQGKAADVAKVATNDRYVPFLINNVFNYYGNNGDGSFNTFRTDNEGFEFPGGKFAPGTIALLTPDGSARQVADGIAFSPWLGIGTDASGAPGFQKVSPMTWIAGPALCDGTCIPSDSDPLNCGGCDVVCDAASGSVCDHGA